MCNFFYWKAKHKKWNIYCIVHASILSLQCFFNPQGNPNKVVRLIWIVTHLKNVTTYELYRLANNSTIGIYTISKWYLYCTREMHSYTNTTCHYSFEATGTAPFCDKHRTSHLQKKTTLSSLLVTHPFILWSDRLVLVCLRGLWFTVHVLFPINGMLTF